MNSFPRLLGVIFLAVVASGSAVGAATYNGTVRSVSGDVATVSMTGDVMPPNGSKAEFFFKIPGIDEEISVATGSVLRIDRGDLLVKIENATGNVESGQLVRFTSSSSATFGATSPPASATPGQTESPAVTASPPALPPTSPEAAASFAEGDAKYDAKDFKGALAAYTKVIELEPAYARGYVRRAATYASLNQPERGLADANEAIRLNPAAAAAFNTRGTCYFAMRKTKQALQAFDEAIRLDQTNAVIYYDRGTVYTTLGKYKLAIEDLTKAIELNPDYENAYYNRALAYKATGKAQLAKQDLAKVRELAAASKSAAKPPKP